MSRLALAVIGLVLFACSLLWIWTIIAKPQMPKRTQPSYYSDEDRNVDFATFLRNRETPLKETIRIGCASGSPTSCKSAKNFFWLFKEAKWKVEAASSENAIFCVRLQIPLDALVLVVHSSKERDTPQNQDIESTITGAFKRVGIPVSISSDPSLPQDTWGVYFEPDL